MTHDQLNSNTFHNAVTLNKTINTQFEHCHSFMLIKLLIFLIPLAFLVTFLLITFGISSPAISNFHYLERIFWPLQLYYHTT